MNKAHEAEGTFIFKADRPFTFAAGVTFAFYIAVSAMHNLFSRCGVLSNFKLNFVHLVSNDGICSRRRGRLIDEWIKSKPQFSGAQSRIISHRTTTPLFLFSWRENFIKVEWAHDQCGVRCAAARWDFSLSLHFSWHASSLFTAGDRENVANLAIAKTPLNTATHSGII